MATCRQCEKPTTIWQRDVFSGLCPRCRAGVAKRIRTLKEGLESIEHEIQDQVPDRDSLEDFKSAIDHVRISVWAILTNGGASATGRTVVATFRLKRATEICDQIISDLEAGAVQKESPELERFATKAQTAATTAENILAGTLADLRSSAR